MNCPTCDRARLFHLTVKRAGVVVFDRDVIGADWFAVWSAALDEHGLGCRIEVRPA